MLMKLEGRRNYATRQILLFWVLEIKVVIFTFDKKFLLSFRVGTISFHELRSTERSKDYVVTMVTIHYRTAFEENQENRGLNLSHVSGYYVD